MTTNNLFEGVAYELINQFEFISSQMSHIVEIQIESYAFILEYLQFDFNLLFTLGYKLDNCNQNGERCIREL